MSVSGRPRRATPRYAQRAGAPISAKAIRFRLERTPASQPTAAGDNRLASSGLPDPGRRRRASPPRVMSHPPGEKGQRHPSMPGRRFRPISCQAIAKALELGLDLNKLYVSVVTTRRTHPMRQLGIAAARTGLRCRRLRLVVSAALPFTGFRRAFLRYSHLYHLRVVIFRCAASARDPSAGLARQRRTHTSLGSDSRRTRDIGPGTPGDKAGSQGSP